MDLDKDVELKEGIKVTVNWEGEKVQGGIVALEFFKLSYL